MLFDVIDTSNLSDHIGLLNVVVCCGPRLKVYVILSVHTTIVIVPVTTVTVDLFQVVEKNSFNSCYPRDHDGTVRGNQGVGRDMSI